MYSDTLKMIVWGGNVEVFTKVDRSLPKNLTMGLFCERYAVGKFIGPNHSK